MFCVAFCCIARVRREPVQVFAFNLGAHGTWQADLGATVLAYGVLNGHDTLELCSETKVYVTTRGFVATAKRMIILLY